jgi:hypothetical protein
MDSKFVLQSKTILSLILATLALWAPAVGIDFTEADKTFVEEAWNEILATGFTAFAAYGRIVANTKVRFT